MDFHSALLFIQHAISLIGVLIILSGVLAAFYQHISLSQLIEN